MSVYQPGPAINSYPKSLNAHNAKADKTGKPHYKTLSSGQRAKKVAVAPFAAVGAGLKSGAKLSLGATALVGGLAFAKHRTAAALVGSVSFVGIPLVATGKGIARFFSNLKAGITGQARQ